MNFGIYYERYIKCAKCKTIQVCDSNYGDDILLHNHTCYTCGTFILDDSMTEPVDEETKYTIAKIMKEYTMLQNKINGYQEVYKDLLKLWYSCKKVNQKEILTVAMSYLATWRKGEREKELFELGKKLKELNFNTGGVTTFKPKQK